MKKLYLWPRFHSIVHQNLSEFGQPQVIEFSQPLSSSMKNVQSAILVAMDSCINELKK